ncbi:MAG TPA: Ada metal-binding domain-containing protein [Planktothrix sp.]|jgi:AraC family transcriptional regulator of adaptative response / DNA-3-methyladenine glycosylase II
MIEGMQLDFDTCYQALQAHDARFDGVFFVAVKSTKIYCRPICPVKVPMSKNCTFYSTAAAAEQAGYRPCLRCRPELAPGNAKVDAVGRLASIVAQHIEDGALTEGSVATLAEELGISERHLRRVIQSEYGVSPLELAQTSRLLQAKRLLTDTNLPITEVAFISGFSSVRRFNSVFHDTYNLSPSQLRKGRRQAAPDQDFVEYTLGYRPPFAWKSILQFLALRTAGGAELIDEDRYIRTVSTPKGKGWIEVFLTDPTKAAAANLVGINPKQTSSKSKRPAKHPKSKEYSVTVRISLSLARSMLPILRNVRQLFDLDANPAVIAKHLGLLAEPRPGLRVPGAFDNFELIVRAILGQQVSVKGATTLMTRYVTEYGEKVETPFAGLSRITPSAARIATVEPADLATKIGIPLKRAETIVAVAKSVANRTLVLDQITDAQVVIDKLQETPGIGPWTAQYVAMRALRWPDAFPHGDLGLRKAMKETNSVKLLAASESWRPWRAYAAMHLWHSLPAAAQGG